MKRSRSDNYPTARIPVEYIQARLKFVRRLDVIYRQAMDERIRECQEQGIEYQHGICTESPDQTLAKLTRLYLRAHNEAMLLPLRLVEVERQQGLRRW